MNLPTPRQRRKAKNFGLILEAAARLIVEKGIENVSLREIAKEADYSPAGLYKYFDGKAAIFRHLLAFENAKLVARLKQLASDLPTEQRLIQSCLLYVEYNLENPAYPSLVNTLSSKRKKATDPIPEHSPYAFFRELVQRWASENQIPLTDSYGQEEMTYAIWAMIHGMATLRLNQLRAFDADFEATNRRTLEIYLNGLRT
jgi:AcrR family transcriptional regulator